jgi:hypothetical protein
MAHKLNVSGHILIGTLLLLLVCELMPKVCPHLSVTPCVLVHKILIEEKLSKYTDCGSLGV